MSPLETVLDPKLGTLELAKKMLNIWGSVTLVISENQNRFQLALPVTELWAIEKT